MPTQAEISAYSAQIYNQARKGTGVNPGLPVALSNLLVAQAKHETGNFGSNAFRQDHNAFGYSYVPGAIYQAGPGLIADNGQPVAKYRSIEDSTKELVDWIWRRRSEGKFPADLNSIQTPEYYGQLLKDAGYYGDTLSNYVKGLKNFFVTNGGLASVAVIIGLIGWIIYRENPALFKL